LLEHSSCAAALRWQVNWLLRPWCALILLLLLAWMMMCLHPLLLGS
jgi:hypothetical protein